MPAWNFPVDFERFGVAIIPIIRLENLNGSRRRIERRGGKKANAEKQPDRFVDAVPEPPFVDPAPTNTTPPARNTGAIPKSRETDRGQRVAESTGVARSQSARDEIEWKWSRIIIKSRPIDVIPRARARARVTLRLIVAGYLQLAVRTANLLVA